MGRNKINSDDKKDNFGISIHPDIYRLLEEQSKKENKSKSKLIEEVMIEYLKKTIIKL